MVKYLAIGLFLLGLGYIVMPGVNQATRQTYYTNDRRNRVTGFYKNEFQKLHCAYFKFLNPFCYIKSLKIIYSPNLASSYLGNKQKSTYLEEYFYPLKDSLIVSGYEPFDEKGKAFDKFSKPLILSGKQYNSVVTIRYYSSSVFSRIFIYILIWISGFFEVILFKKIIKKYG